MAEAAPAPPNAEKSSYLYSIEITLWTVVPAVQALEKKVDSCLARLLTPEGCSGTSEKKLADCEKTAVEFSSQLEGKLAELGTLPQESRLLQQRLENMKNLMGNWNFWVQRLPPGNKGEVPKAFLSPEQAPSPASPAQEELNQRQTPEQQQEEATMIPPEPGTGIPASTSPLSLKQEEESAEGGELPPSPSTDSLPSVEPDTRAHEGSQVPSSLAVLLLKSFRLCSHSEVLHRRGRG